MLSVARCEKCNHALPLRGELMDFRLPPDTVSCPSCQHPCGTILPYRVGWMEALVFKVLVVSSVPISVALAALLSVDPSTRWLVALLGPPVGGGLGGFLLGKLLGFPITLIRDNLRKRR